MISTVGRDGHIKIYNLFFFQIAAMPFDRKTLVCSTAVFHKLFLFVLMFIYLFLRERQSVGGGEAERERET